MPYASRAVAEPPAVKVAASCFLSVRPAPSRPASISAAIARLAREASAGALRTAA